MDIEIVTKVQNDDPSISSTLLVLF